jgi:hypothetical protein
MFRKSRISNNLREKVEHTAVMSEVNILVRVRYTIGHSHNIDEPPNSYFATILAETPSRNGQEG